MHHSAHDDHSRHDVLLIAGHAAGDLSNVDAAAAASLLSSCTACADIHRDLLALSMATRSLPRLARAPRDFRITAEQAARLHRGSWLRSLLRPFAAARSATAPMAAAVTSAGVVGLLVAAFFPALLGSAASVPEGDADAFAPGPAATQAPIAVPAQPEAGDPGAAAASDGPNFVNRGEDSGMEVLAGGGTDDRDGAVTEGDEGPGRRLASTGPPNLLVLGSLGLVGLGLALFGLRLASRRLR